MKLELRSFPVDNISFSSASGFENGSLKINQDQLAEIVMTDNNFASVEINLAFPGDRTRIIHILDVLDARTKVAGRGTIYPGFLGPPVTAGNGITHKIDNVAILNTAIIETRDTHKGEGNLLRPRERIVDMSGSGAKLSPFSSTLNIVLNYKKKDGVSPEDYFASIRLAGLKISDFLASLTKNSKSYSSNIHSLENIDSSLPNVGYVYQISSAGFCRDTFLYGADFHGMYPTLIHPNEILDGALVNSCVSQFAIPTYIHCNNRVVNNLYKRHAKDFNFVGVVITKGDAISDFMKQRCAHYTVKLLKMLKANGIVLTQERGGNTVMDQMFACKFAEEAGIKTVVITYEIGGVEGKDIPLIFSVPEADAIVSTGNREEKVDVPAVEKVLGGDKILYTEVNAGRELELYVNDFLGSIEQTGFHNMTTREI